MNSLTRPALGIAVVVLVLVTAGGYWRWNVTPTRDAVADDMVFGFDVVAYEVSVGVPYVTYLDPAHGVVIDTLRRDVISRDFPGWQLTGNRYAIRATDGPVSVGLARCAGQLSGSGVEPGMFGCRTRSIVFGQINDPAIVAIEVEYEGAWHRYSVAAPGYVVALAPFRGIPSGYRWLDAAGVILEEHAPVPELLWH